jgi:hypothetical protein
MPVNTQKNLGTGINDIEYDINGNPTGVMPVRTIGQTQATPAPSAGRISSVAQIQYDALGNPIGSFAADDAPVATTARTPAQKLTSAPKQAPTSGGVGAGTSPNAYSSRGNDNTPPASASTTQQAINTAYANQLITTQPNVLDQYASYTYAISWWLLTPSQYNNLTTGLAPAPNTGNWALLMQSGGAPTSGRNWAFPYDYYLDDLEIDSTLAGKGTGMSTNAMTIRFKVVEPNGLTLIQNLFRAVSAAYGTPASTTVQQVNAGQTTAATVNATQTSQIPNYVAAQYCLTIEFYGYDSQGNLVAPARGQLAGSTAQAVIKKYYPFVIDDLKFRTANNQVEYLISGKPVPYSTATSQSRGTIPYAIQLAGQTVTQLLQGGPLPAAVTAPDPGARTTTPEPARVATPSKVADLPMRQQAAIAAGTDPNAVNPDGMAFGGGGL